MSVRELRVQIRLSVQPWTGRSERPDHWWENVGSCQREGGRWSLLCHLERRRTGWQTGGGVWRLGQYGMKVGYQPVNTRAGWYGEADDWGGSQNPVEGISEQRLSETLENDWRFGGLLTGNVVRGFRKWVGCWKASFFEEGRKDISGTEHLCYFECWKCRDAVCWREGPRAVSSSKYAKRIQCISSYRHC